MTRSGSQGSQRRPPTHLPILPILLFVLLSCACLAAQTRAPERRVTSANLIESDRDPAALIQLPKSAQYVGADRWALYGVADCELHVFVEADAQRRVRRLYWVQFEGYLPTKPKLQHEYTSPRHTKIGGLDFYVDTWVRAHDAAITPGSDREHVQALLRARGYEAPPGVMIVRLVHLLDDRKRQELMIIYAEDLAPLGLTAAELQEGGKAFDRWPAIAAGLVERARAAIAIRETAKPSGMRGMR